MEGYPCGRMHLRSRRNQDEDIVFQGNNRWGPGLAKDIGIVKSVSSSQFPVGMRVWAKTPGYSDWPGIIWDASLCFKKILPAIIQSYKPGSLLIRFYGDHSSMWREESQLQEITEDYDDRVHRLQQWGRQVGKNRLVELALEELESSFTNYQEELKRMLQLQCNLLGDMSGSVAACDTCGELGAELKCDSCERYFHTLCLEPPSMSVEDIQNGGLWSCISCGEENEAVKQDPNPEDERCERYGLTPDWIIHKGAFDVFQLEPPTEKCPYIKGLLDPCTNSKVAPNIPAEVLYDKLDNGLIKLNSWSGYYVILNPDFKAQVQWRFVNRAIDEVENDRVPAVILVCRNSTDSAYFQRLTPYPRVLLRRRSALFKDYDKSPIGFGIIVFCIAKGDCHDLFTRFIKHFGPAGEPNIVVDKDWLQTTSFSDGFERLKEHVDQFQRDHWIQCVACQKWRIISFESMLAARDQDWNCKDLSPPYTSCETPQLKAEIAGSRYAIVDDSGDEERLQEDLCFFEKIMKPDGCNSSNQCETSSPVAGKGSTSTSSLHSEKTDKFPLQSGPAEKVNQEDRSIKCQVLSGLELCRQAQIVANEACLKHISQGCEGDINGLECAVEEAQRSAWIRIRAVAQDQFLRCKSAYEMKAKAVKEEEARAKQVLKILRDEEVLANQALLIAMQNLETQKRKL